jgi:hypothetical protein
MEGQIRILNTQDPAEIRDGFGYDNNSWVMVLMQI